MGNGIIKHNSEEWKKLPVTLAKEAIKPPKIPEDNILYASYLRHTTITDTTKIYYYPAIDTFELLSFSIKIQECHMHRTTNLEKVTQILKKEANQEISDELYD